MEAAEWQRMARVIRGGRWAALATCGEGVPLASMVAYVGEEGFAGFLMHLSRLSRHTRNLLESPSASLAISETDSVRVRDPQTLARISIQGMARPIPGGSPDYRKARAVYEKRFPDSPPLFEFRDFLLFRLVPAEARFVAGFARAFTVNPAGLQEAATLRTRP